MKTKSFIFVMIAFVAFACKKDPPIPEPELPPLTHQGLNTFGCRVNGKVWVAEVPFSVGGPIKVNTVYNKDDGHFVVVGSREIKKNEDFIEIICYGEEIITVGEYQMHVADDNEAGLIDAYKNQYNCGGYLHNIDNPGKINITFLDTSARIISGTFEMDLINHPSCESETLKITEGRFDLLY